MMHGLLVAVAFLGAEHGLYSVWASAAVARRLYSRGAQCPVACGTFPDQGWDSCPLH